MKRKSTPASNEEIVSRANNSEAESKKVVLQRTLDDLTKRFGDGSIVLLGNNSKMQVDVISTGSLTLDIATGVGGLPRGRITEIYGPEASGKCVIKNCIIYSEYGMMTIGELWEHEGYNPSCTSRTVEHEVGLINENGVIEKTSHLTWNNRKEVKYIKTSSGLEMGATLNHPIRVMSKNGNIVWREVGKVQVGDTVVVMRDTQQFGSNELTAEEATWIGYLVADGHLGSKSAIQFSNSDLDVAKDYNRISANLFPEKAVKVYERSATSISHYISSTAIRSQVFEKYQLDYVNANGKEVPLVIRQASREAQVAFLRAYIELECHIDLIKRTIEVTSASKLLLQQVQLMLLNLGIVSRLSEKPVQGYEQMYYRLNWGGTGFFKYGEIIGFQSEARIKVYESADSVTPVNTNVDSIPNLGSLLRDLYDAVDTDRAINKLMGDYMGDNPKANLTYDRLALIIEAMGSKVSGLSSSILNHLINLQEAHFFFDPVAEITDGIEPTFDVVMPETHSFWSSGMISHNTSICLHSIAEAQKKGGVCAFIDMEHALDPRYASRLGVNLDTLYIAQPDTGEQALEMTEALIRSGSVDVIVVDSVAALVPRAEIEGEMGDSHVGLQARLMSQALRKINGAIKTSNCIVIFTNQLREKIGVMFGCFSYDSRIVLADGTIEKIGKIVNNKMNVEVLSFNNKTQQFEPRKIVNWFNNGKTDSFLQLVVKTNDRHGRNQFGVTSNHQILTSAGYMSAGELEIGDTVISSVKYYLDQIHQEIVRGSVLGDGSLRYTNDYNVQLRIGHGKYQIDYCKWKQELFDGLVKYSASNSRGGWGFDTIPMYELSQVYEDNYPNGKYDPSADLINNLSPLALAIWYMDDGCLYAGIDKKGRSRNPRSTMSIRSLSSEKRQLVEQWFTSNQIEVKVDYKGTLVFSVEGTRSLHKIIAPYVHPSMEHKLLPEYRNQFVEITTKPCIQYKPVEMPIINIYDKPKTRSMNRFDIEVEGNHNYVVDNIVVHNSNETTSGGRALKFYASMRLDMRRIQTIKNGDEVVGGRSKIKVVKNKVAAPFREAEFDLMMNRGISKNGEIIDLGIAIGLIDKRGAFLRYNDVLLGQGRPKAIEFLAANKSLALELENIIRDKFDKDNDILFSPPTLEEEADSKLDIEIDSDGVINSGSAVDYVTPYDEKA